MPAVEPLITQPGRGCKTPIQCLWELWELGAPPRVTGNFCPCMERGAKGNMVGKLDTPTHRFLHEGFWEGPFLKQRCREAHSCLFGLSFLGVGLLGLGLGVSLSWFRTLAHSGLSVLVHSGSLALWHTWMGTLMGTGRCRAHQGLRPCMIGSPFLEAGHDAGISALLGSSLWDTMIQCSVAHGAWTAMWGLRAVHLRP